MWPCVEVIGIESGIKFGWKSCKKAEGTSFTLQLQLAIVQKKLLKEIESRSSFQFNDMLSLRSHFTSFILSGLGDAIGTLL